MANLSRRGFFRNGTLATGGLLLGRVQSDSDRSLTDKHDVNALDLLAETERINKNFLPAAQKGFSLAPAKWIWFPSRRTLANSIMLFRREISLDRIPIKAIGFVVGDSRYKLYLNGKRIQFGPAPYDPRWAEADPVNFTGVLTKGINLIGAEVLFYGLGDGAMPIGKPGFIFLMQLEYANGDKENIFSDEHWQTSIADSWKPGGYKRWYLRSFQEIFDARLYPFGWNIPGTGVGKNWISAALLDAPSDRPSLSSRYPDYLYDTQGKTGTNELRPRSISMPAEPLIPVSDLVEKHWLNWTVSPEDYFDFLIPNAYSSGGEISVSKSDDGWSYVAGKDQAAVVTFVLREQVVGFPFFTINAPEGTVVELLVHEGHDTGGDPLINTHFNSWSRFICREGKNEFETFDYESFRFLQLHIRNAGAKINVSHVGVRRRIYAWQREPKIEVSDPVIQQVLNAAVNTVYNSCIETCVDGMARERQQYSGDGGHQLHAVQLAFGEPSIHARFCNTYSQGSTMEGYFMDSWPAYDRMARIFERQLDLSEWGPLLDHSIGFNFDCYYYYLYTGEVESIREVFPRLTKFLKYMLSLKRADGLLPVEDVGVHWIWMDTDSFPKQSYKKCAFNLYAVSMMRHAYAPLARAFGEPTLADYAEAQSDILLNQTQKTFWSNSLGTFVDNPDEATPHFNERALSLAILFDLCVNNQWKNTAELMISLPKTLGRSYPANAGWNYWAYGKIGRTDLIINELRERWPKMLSVKLNNTLQESWEITPDSNGQWSHCAVAPLFCFYMDIAGIRPLKPGWAETEIHPQTGDLENVKLTIPAGPGDIYFHASGRKGSRSLTIKLPENTNGVLVVNENEKLSLPEISSAGGLKKFKLAGGKEIIVSLKYT